MLETIMKKSEKIKALTKKIQAFSKSNNYETIAKALNLSKKLKNISI